MKSQREGRMLRGGESMFFTSSIVITYDSDKHKTLVRIK